MNENRFNLQKNIVKYKNKQNVFRQEIKGNKNLRSLIGHILRNSPCPAVSQI
jgi:hypothetical protein